MVVNYLLSELQDVNVCMCDVQTAADELRELQRDMADLEQLRRELAEYFCDDENTFQLDDCIKTFSAFFDSFQKAVEVSKHINFTAQHGMPARTSHEKAVCPSVCLSVKYVNCDKTEESSAEILIPYEISFMLVF